MILIYYNAYDVFNVNELFLILQNLSGLRFSSLPNTASLNLAHNQVLYIDDYSVFEGLPLLENLNLYGDTDISTFPNYRMENLRILKMSECEVTSIAHFDLPRIESIDLSLNNLTNVDPAPLMASATLREIDFTGNNLHCDCNLKPFVDWTIDMIYDNKIRVIDADMYTCDTPDDFYMEALMDAMDNLTCTEGESKKFHGALVSTFVCISVVVLVLVLVLAGMHFRKRLFSTSGSSNSIDDVRFVTALKCCRSKSANTNRASSEIEQQELMTVRPSISTVESTEHGGND